MAKPDDLTSASDVDVLGRTRPTILVVDQVGKIIQAHGGYGRPLGFPPEEVIGHNSLDFMAPEDHAIMAETYVLSSNLPIVGAPEPFPLRLIGPDGVTRTWDCVPGGISKGGHGGWVVVLTCRAEQNAAVKAMDCFISGGTPLEIATLVAEHFNDGSQADFRKHALVVHRGLAAGTGDPSQWQLLEPAPEAPPELVAAVVESLSDPLAPWLALQCGDMAEFSELPVPMRRAMDAVGFPYCTAHAVGCDAENQIVFVRFSDASFTLEGNNRLAMREVGSVLTRALWADRSHELLAHAVRSDPLTGIANRLRFDEVIDDTDDASHHAVLFADIDRFKLVNDEFGHAVGDATLRHVADRIVAACRPQDLVARIGGDEFAVILRDVTTADAHHIAARIRESMSVGLADLAGPKNVSVTVGVAEPDAGVDLAELVRRADHAMLADKAVSRISPR